MLFGAVLGILLVVGGLAAAVASGLLLRDEATPISIQEVLRRFEEGGERSGALDGVYLYATRGTESVDALGGATHRYPAKTTITVRSAPCGLTLTWDALEARSVSWTLCATEAGIELRGWEVAHRFFGQSDSTRYACDEGLLVASESSAGDTSPLRCRSSRGEQSGETRVVGLEQIAVAGARLRAVHVRTEGQVSGGDDGTEIVDWWIAERNGLPLRISLESRTSRPLLIGDVHYSEDADLRLLSMRPLR